jgi:hypothetical protein
MKQFTTGPRVPEAHICINKSKLKIYNKETDPTFYLEDGQEFQIELYNPTEDTILAKIHLNDKPISQGGLVLKPGQRVFLERYLDVARKFLFETYEVSNSTEVKEAIKKNGDFKVQFFRESRPFYNLPIVITTYTNHYPWNQPHVYRMSDQNQYNGLQGLSGNIKSANAFFSSTNMDVNGLVGSTTTYNSNANFSSSVTLDGMGMNDAKAEPLKKSILRSAKKIETGRVEQGSSSDQELTYVNKSFDLYAFCTVEYKMLPVSQKINTVDDVNVARYCGNCGTKQKAEHNFCPTCGQKK